ncbi:MAG: response regulator transcription factor [Cyclobacteriaceae bacterium]|nr:response regulator transcription factor [Cyclobacteriaceae bacterium HetDA_MAG_MS6]
MDKIKVLIADDHEMILDGLRLLLEQQEDIEVIAESYNGSEVLSAIEKVEELDVAILDINMPEKDGIETTQEIKKKFPEVKVLILTMYNRKEFIKNLMEAGTDGYILKNSGKEELVKAIRSLAKGEPYFGKEITKTIMKSYQKNKIFDSPLDIELTEREKDIIKLVAEGLSTQEIADQIFLSAHTVNTHRRNILNKLNVKNSAGMIRYGIQTGIVRDFDL